LLCAWAKHVIGDFNFFDPFIALRGAQDNLEVEKPREIAAYVFCHHTKNDITNH
jgi:hypothetical protein